MDIRNINNFMIKQNIDYDKNIRNKKPMTGNKSSIDISQANSKQSLDDYAIDISDEAKALLAEEKALEQQEIEEEKKQQLKRQMEEQAHLKEELMRQHEASKDNPFDAMIKCFEIARRILSGDTVPPKDEQFLQENDPGMYSNSMIFRKQKDDSKELKSILEDEDSVEEVTESTSGSEVSMEGPDVDITVPVEE